MDVSHGWHIFRDGNAWCAVGPHFVDLMQLKAGFGDTPDAAIVALRGELDHDPWWRNKPLPTLDKFTIHNLKS